ncbi:right-handed parallel beta-helix repeat-containing protein [Limibacter armeniacum]|uniref:right-handed parallel beta-helix repeat-containing protein n=1 Tax=Limibacter armeniacum TaxID=466084 RepID=UPI002FE63B4C
MKCLVLTNPILSLLLYIWASPVFAQECGCDHTIPLSVGYNWFGDHVKPGETVCLEAGKRNSQLVINNLKGTSENRIIVKNCGGLSSFNVPADKSFVLKFLNSSDFILSGDGDEEEKYGIELSGGVIGLQLTGLTTDFEVKGIHVHDVSFAGVMAKTDPSCDERTWRGNFVMKNISIHHNLVHHTKGGEGFYVGNSFFAGGMDKECGKVYPHEVVNLDLYNNRVHDTGAEGIQVGCAVKGCRIYGNYIERTGLDPFNGRSNQQNGIQLGEGTGGMCYNNIVKDAKGNAIIVLGLGDNMIFNNILIRPEGAGMFIDERFPSTITGPGSGYRVYNNTIIQPRKHGVWIYAEEVEKNEVVNNIIVAPGSGQYISHDGCPGLPNVIDSNNLKAFKIGEVGFVNPETDDYRLGSDSPAIGYGTDLSDKGVIKDIIEQRRENGRFDAGAFNFNH